MIIIQIGEPLENFHPGSGSYLAACLASKARYAVTDHHRQSPRKECPRQSRLHLGLFPIILDKAAINIFNLMKDKLRDHRHKKITDQNVMEINFANMILPAIERSLCGQDLSCFHLLEERLDKLVLGFGGSDMGTEVVNWLSTFEIKGMFSLKDEDKGEMTFLEENLGFVLVESKS